jgi:hypothetical protein
MRFSELVDLDYKAFEDMDSSGKYMHRVKDNTDSYSVELTAEELRWQIAVPLGDKPYFQVSVEAVLTHLVMEDMIHYDELSAALRQLGLKAP